MITVTTTQTRPSADVPFFIDANPESRDILLALVNTTQHLAAPPSFSLSEDGLTHTTVAVFIDQNQYDAFMTELEAVLPGFISARDEYSLQNGIQVNKTTNVS